jgi:hypothetical protein
MMPSAPRGLPDPVGDMADAREVEFEGVAVAELSQRLISMPLPAESTPMLNSSPGTSCSLSEAWASMSPSPNREPAVCGRATVSPLMVTVPRRSPVRENGIRELEPPAANG